MEMGMLNFRTGPFTQWAADGDARENAVPYTAFYAGRGGGPACKRFCVTMPWQVYRRTAIGGRSSWAGP